VISRLLAGVPAFEKHENLVLIGCGEAFGPVRALKALHELFIFDQNKREKRFIPSCQLFPVPKEKSHGRVPQRFNRHDALKGIRPKKNFTFFQG
jgi:hypothetical protein